MEPKLSGQWPQSLPVVPGQHSRGIRGHDNECTGDELGIYRKGQRKACVATSQGLRERVESVHKTNVSVFMNTQEHKISKASKFRTHSFFIERERA